MEVRQASEQSIDEPQQVKEGPIKIIDPEQVPKEPHPLLEGFEWVTMNLMDDKEVICLIEDSVFSADRSIARRGMGASKRALRRR